MAKNPNMITRFGSLRKLINSGDQAKLNVSAQPELIEEEGEPSMARRTKKSLGLTLTQRPFKLNFPRK
jgi:hypothetical protein